MNTERSTLQPGAVVGNLRVDRVLGQGAFSVTYRVTDPGRSESFALKEYFPRELGRRLRDGRLEAADESVRRSYAEGLQAFLAEGRTAAQLEHAHVVRVLRCFEANGSAYLLMPCYRGEALDSLLRRTGVFSAEEVLALAQPLLDALDYLHGQGIIHRDIKPANIFVTETGDPILLDFGAAAADVETLGSEGYAAIEQYGPSDGGVGPWTDIYGLAATLYRCISRHVPVAAPERQSAVEAGAADPLPPVDGIVTANASPAVQDAIAWGLAIDPRRRPQSVREWRAAFGKPETGEAGGLGRPGLPEGFQPEGREWLPMILLGLFFLALAAGLVYLLTDRGPGTPESIDRDTETIDTRDPGSDVPLPASAAETARWQAALVTDTGYAYQLFLTDFPDSMHREKALLHLARLDTQAWESARAEGGRAAIEAYLANFPGGAHETDARIALNEIRLAEEAAERARQQEMQRDEAAWERVRAARTLVAVDKYLADWPAGTHADEARELRAELTHQSNDARAFDMAEKTNTIAAYRNYIEAFPQGQRIADALEAIDRLTLRPGSVFQDCPSCPEMVVVPAGSFWQGTDESAPGALRMETPQRMVSFARPFAVGVFEVTFAQWDECTADGGCTTRPVDNGWGRGDRPVIMVSWNDAQEYTAWLSSKTGQAYSLPSESQWEYAARAGEESEWLGGDPARVCEYGNVAGAETGFGWQHDACSDPTVAETLPAGTLRPNAFGVHDAIGNVAEWTLDCLNLSYLDAPADGSAWGQGICGSRMTRGGSWFTGTREIRLPARFNLKTGDRNDFTGFRVVRTVEPQ
ncbi:MAG: bifunctional serine/threonine-protein kinase/formylglycine-generating enzyme family protein [Xanthomonadales bacterium]|nr:bifunctional serine/threonine-protein kinase/formylglycine-generating enzyme family protein [Xanthomonadales bacterium]